MILQHELSSSYPSTVSVSPNEMLMGSEFIMFFLSVHLFVFTFLIKESSSVTELESINNVLPSDYL